MSDKDKVIRDLKCCNKGIDVWENSTAYVVRFERQQLSYFYDQRDIALAALKEYKT